MKTILKWQKFAKSGHTGQDLLASRGQNCLDGADGLPSVTDEERDVTELRHRRQEPHVIGKAVHVLKNAEIVLR